MPDTARASVPEVSEGRGRAGDNGANLGRPAVGSRLAGRCVTTPPAVLRLSSLLLSILALVACQAPAATIEQHDAAAIAPTQDAAATPDAVAPQDAASEA